MNVTCEYPMESCALPGKECAHDIRSVFISDLHLGSRFSRATEVLEFLKPLRPEYLYLVGDIVDFWALRRSWHWPSPYDALLNHLAELVNNGTQLFYTPGNHDSALRRFQTDEPPVLIRDEFIHQCADGRQMVVMHGDQFDRVEGRAKWLSVIGSVAYDLLLVADRSINRVLKSLDFAPWRVSSFVKRSVKKAVQFISGFEGRVAEHARDKCCDGIICGHIHVPRYQKMNDVLYVNLGDWVENTTALVEFTSGELVLLEKPCELFRQNSKQAESTRMNLDEELSPVAARIARQVLGSIFSERMPPSHAVNDEPTSGIEAFI
jgi:UDP-2,3-diacylglucosamine pyrophosphatase LpxH